MDWSEPDARDILLGAERVARNWLPALRCLVRVDLYVGVILSRGIVVSSPLGADVFHDTGVVQLNVSDMAVDAAGTAFMLMILP